MTEKQQQVYDALAELGDKHPTVRSLADHMETRYHRAERFSDNEVHGLLARLEADGHVAKYDGPKGERRWMTTGQETGPGQ